MSTSAATSDPREVNDTAAVPAPTTATAVGSTQHLTFTLAGETFAIGILAIKEIIENRGITEVPKSPPCVCGVINLRGAVVPVLDLLARFGKPSSTVGKRTCIVVIDAELHGERQVMGVMVDSVNEVLDIAHEDIEPPPSFGMRIGREFIAGMARVRGKFVTALDMQRVLAIPSPDDADARAELSELALA